MGRKLSGGTGEGGADGKKRKRNQFGTCESLHLELVENKLF